MTSDTASGPGAVRSGPPPVDPASVDPASVDPALPEGSLKASLLRRSTLLRTIREDRQVNLGWMEPGFHALAVYRLGRWGLDTEDAPAWARRGAELAYRLGHRATVSLYGIDLPRTARIGRGVVVQETAVSVHPSSVVGDRCILRKGVTLGGLTGGEDFHREAPVLGEGVSVGVNTVVAGAVTVGDRAAIGPNVALLTSVPADALVVSPRPRILKGMSANGSGSGAT